MFHRRPIKYMYVSVLIFDGTTVKNKGKLVLTKSSLRCKNMTFKSVEKGITLFSQSGFSYSYKILKLNKWFLKRLYV